MLNTVKPVFLAILLASATGAIAQETPAAETDTAPAAELDMGTPISETEGELQEGQPYIRDVFGDWSQRCLKAAEGPDPCQLYQLLLDTDGNQVAEISLFPLPEGNEAAAGATIVAPLETLLTQQLTLTVDGSTPRRYPFSFCNQAGCVARVGFTQEHVDQFKRGAKATLRLVPAAAPDQEINLDVSLTGFTAAYNNAAQ